MNVAPAAPRWTAPARPTAGRAILQSPHRFATGFVLVYTFLLVSRFVEVLPKVIGTNIHPILILLPLGVVAAVFAGGLVEGIKSPVFLMFSAFTGWICLATLSSQWKGGSANLIVFIWIPSFASMLFVVSLISNLKQCRQLFYTLAFSLVAILLTTIVFHAAYEGRDGSDISSLGNPNDLAFAILVLLPFAVFVVQNESRANWKSVLCLSAVGFALFRILRTGSRMGLLALVVISLILFLAGKLKTKITLFAALAVIAVLAALTVSDSILTRYTTLFRGTTFNASMSDDEISAVESTRARQMLFQESVRLMFEHPLLGVGPSVFSAALAGEQEKKGQIQTWHEAHNSFSQLGSEAGIPALGIYLAVFFYCLKRTVSIFRRTRRDPRLIATTRMAACLFMSLIAFGICAAFGNYSYSFHFPVIAGLVQAFDIAVRKEARVAPATAAPVLAPRRTFAPVPNPEAPNRVLATTAAAPMPPKRTFAPVSSQVPNYVRNRRLPNGRA